MKVEITRHAEQCMREQRSETKGNLNKWVTSVYFLNESANNIRVYGNTLFIFDGNKLVTVYYIPRNLTKNLENMVKRE